MMAGPAPDESAIHTVTRTNAALKLDFETVIPGHGPITNSAGFLKWRFDSTAICSE